MVVLSILAMTMNYPEIWNDFKTPEGVDRQLMIDTICAECADLSLLHTQPDTLQCCIEMWTRRRFPIWQKLLATTQYDYDPISNYDRHEEWSDNAESSGNSTAVSQIQSFDSDAFADRDKSSGDSSGRSSAKHTGHLYGNIGVTTTQQMIAEERRSVQFDIYQEIMHDFKQEFCILIY